MKWRRGASPFLAGLLVGLGVAGYRVWLLLGVAFFVGVLACWAVSRSGRLVRWIGSRAEHRSPLPAGWHMCQNPQCQAPIGNHSRARYCSEPCRRYARLRLEAGSAALEEIPF